MQTFTSAYGRKGIRVSDLCPTRAIRWKLGSLHVGTPTDDVERLVREAATARMDEGSDLRWTPALIREAVRFARWQHEENRAEYAYVMS